MKENKQVVKYLSHGKYTLFINIKTRAKINDPHNLVLTYHIVQFRSTALHWIDMEEGCEEKVGPRASEFVIYPFEPIFLE